MGRILDTDHVMNDPETILEIRKLALTLVMKARRECADGEFDYLRELRTSLSKSKRAYRKYLDRMNLAWDIVFMGYDEPQPIFNWAKEAIDIGNL